MGDNTRLFLRMMNGTLRIDASVCWLPAAQMVRESEAGGWVVEYDSGPWVAMAHPKIPDALAVGWRFEA